MKSILEEFWYGNIDPQVDATRDNKEVKNLLALMDYFQVFELTAKEGCQEIFHFQELPEWQETLISFTDEAVTEKVYIINDGEHETMLLAEDY